MSDPTYKLIEVVGTSEKDISKAIENAVETAAKTVQGISWFQVTEVRGMIKDGEVAQYQVGVKLGFRVMGHEEMR